jgi:hypothetical protein
MWVNRLPPVNTLKDTALHENKTVHIDDTLSILVVLLCFLYLTKCNARSYMARSSFTISRKAYEYDTVQHRTVTMHWQHATLIGSLQNQTLVLSTVNHTHTHTHTAMTCCCQLTNNIEQNINMAPSTLPIPKNSNALSSSGSLIKMTM